MKRRTLAELIALAKKNPEKLNFASAGNGTTHHLAGELFQLQTKTRLVHVPYRGAGPALQDIVAGQVDILFDGLGSSAPQIQSGRLRGLAVAAPTRSEAIPDVPTAKEAGLEGYEVATWYALWAPKGTPAEIVTRMRAEVDKALKTQLISDTWKKNGSPVPALSGEAFGKFVTAEIARWGAVVKRRRSSWSDRATCPQASLASFSSPAPSMTARAIVMLESGPCQRRHVLPAVRHPVAAAPRPQPLAPRRDPGCRRLVLGAAGAGVLRQIPRHALGREPGRHRARRVALAA